MRCNNSQFLSSQITHFNIIFLSRKMVEMMQFIILGVLNVGENQTVTKLLFLFKLEKIKVIQKSNNNL